MHVGRSVCSAKFSDVRICPYAQHIVEYKEVPWFPSGTKVMPCHNYEYCSKIGCVMEDSMKNINRLPKYMPGQVIDLSYKHKGLPNRLLIKTAFIREHDDQWMYEVFLENIGEVTTLNEEFISANMTNKATQVYKCAEIINLYNGGWRFCGNHKRSLAHSVASKSAVNRYIKNIILRPALDSKGCLQNDYYGMWIKYNTIINDDGTVITSDCEDRDTIIIK